MDADLWKRFRMIAILNEMEISELVEQALREKLERMKQLEQYPEYKDVKDLHVPIDINLPGLEFPADKSKIIKLAEEANYPKRVNYLKFISDREYKNKSDLKNELLKDIKNSKVDFRINTEKLRKEQYKEKILEQERQPIIK